LTKKGANNLKWKDGTILPENTCYIIAGGDLLAPIELYKGFLFDKKPILAADRGGEYLWEMGIYPDYLLGDFDSIAKKVLFGLKKAGVQTTGYPEEKDETDLEIAAEFALQKGYKKIIILGAWGGRPDQSIAGISVLHKIKKHDCHGVILNPGNSLELLSRGVELQKEKGERFSLVAWGGTVEGLKITGCKYNVCEAVLRPWETLGISNRIVEETAKISFDKGLALLIRESNCPFAVEKHFF